MSDFGQNNLLDFELGDIDVQDENEFEELKPNKREDRLRHAFKQSKASYKNERIFTEAGWYYDQSEPWPSKLHVRNTDYTLNGLYFAGRYQEVLNLALHELESSSDHGVDAQVGRRKELHDLAMRCAMNLKNDKMAGQIADWTKPKWPASPGLAATAADAYLFASRPRDALSAILSAISTRGILPPYTTILPRCLEALHQQSDNPIARDAFQQMLSLVRPHTRLFKPLFKAPPDQAILSELPITNDDLELPHHTVIPEQELAQSWIQACGIEGVDGDRLVSLLCRKNYTREKEDFEGRSVRTL